MIISASRRTDIPHYYGDWFFRRLKEGFLWVRNPLNPKQVSRISLSPAAVDCIVFWTKDPEPVMGRLEELRDYDYYFQFTLTGYGREVEPGLPDKETVLLPAFRRLAKQIGSERTVWRYDPILFSDTYTAEWHLDTFGRFADALQGYTKRCVISFADLYVGNRKGMAAIGAAGIRGIVPLAAATASVSKGWTAENIGPFASRLKAAADRNGMELVTCAEQADLSEWGIEHGSCIDPKLIEQITGFRMKGKKDPGQRPECGCMQSIDVGAYHTCPCGCVYCYAGGGGAAAERNFRQHRPDSPLLCGRPGPEDEVRERGMPSLKEYQMSLF